jgi:hypothetical protein
MAIQSQTFVLKLVSPRFLETARPGSQNWTTRGSFSRDKTAEEGELQSDWSTRSHTTNTFHFEPGTAVRIRLSAEAPCRHFIQVGDSRTRRLVVPGEAFHWSRTESKLASSTSGGWPSGGV